jgi:putative N6-adenine-specific DNA methylase
MPVEEIETMYKEIGNKLKKDFGGYTAWIITSSPEAINAVGLRATRRIHLYNGSLECRYLKYELYAGSKKASKQPSEQPKPTE